MRIKRKYGWQPDVPDYRDYRVDAVRPDIAYKAKTGSLQTGIDLRPLMSAVEDQGILGSCSANAIVGAIEYLENTLQVHRGPNKQYVELSRLFLYFNERLIEGTVNSDSGAYLRDGIKALAKYGVCTEPHWPYLSYRLFMKPGQSSYDDARARRIKAYARVTQNIQSIKACLASRYPIIFGFAVFEDFESLRVATTGTVNLPLPGETFLGGHAGLAVGYDDLTQRILVRNSWGAGWGTGGYYTLPYRYLTDPNLADDLWIIYR